MTNLKEINFGMNQYCGPAVLSALTGESTDRCAAVISAVSGRQEIKAVQVEHLIEAFKRLRFDVKKIETFGRSLYTNLQHLSDKEGFYIVLVPKHVVAIEVAKGVIYLVDNHSKTPLPANSSARLMQKVDGIYKVSRKAESKFLRSEIRIILFNLINSTIKGMIIQRVELYENENDNILVPLGQFIYKDEKELNEIINNLKTKQQLL